MSEEMNLDGVIVPGSPDWALNYVGARWDRYNDWTHITNAPIPEWDALPHGERQTISARLQWLVSNDPYARALLNAWVTHLGQPTLRSKSTSKNYNDAKERFWLSYAEGCEVSGMSLAEVIDAIYYELLTAGECFALKLRDGRIQLIPSEFVFSQTDGEEENETQGILYDATGNPVGYRIGFVDSRGRIVAGKKFVPAAQVLHIFHRQRIRQRRGVPFLAAAVQPLRDLSELVSARITTIKNQAFLSFVIVSEAGGSFPQLGDAANANGATKQTGQPTKYATMRPGMTLRLAKGDDIKMLSPEFKAVEFDQFLISRLRAIGAGIGMPLELYLEGYRDSNFSSARATNLAWGKKVRAIRSLIERRFLQPLQLWATERARAAKVLKGGNRELDGETFWGWPAIPEVDAQKETQANVEKLAAGLTTYSAVYAEQNLFWEDEFDQRAREKKYAREAEAREGIPPGSIIPAPETPAPESSAPAREEPAPDVPAPGTEPARGDISEDYQKAA